MQKNSKYIRTKEIQRRLHRLQQANNCIKRHQEQRQFFISGLIQIRERGAMSNGMVFPSTLINLPVNPSVHAACRFTGMVMLTFSLL